MNDEGIKHMPGSVDDDDPGELKIEQAKIMDRLKRDKARIRRLRVLTIVLWALFVVGFLVGGFTERRLKAMSFAESTMLVYLIIALMVIVIVAVVCSVSLYIRWRSLTQQQVLASLAGIEKALQELSSKRD